MCTRGRRGGRRSVHAGSGRSRAADDRDADGEYGRFGGTPASAYAEGRLTGGLACGKSFVGEALAGYGCLLVQADELGHQVLAPGGEAYEDVVREFGRGYSERGRRDRPAGSGGAGLRRSRNGWLG